MPPATTKEIRIDPVRDRRVWLEREAFALSKTCPADHTNPVECPLCDLRPLPLHERREWIGHLSDEELEYLASYHRACFAQKMAAKGGCIAGKCGAKA